MGQQQVQNNVFQNYSEWHKETRICILGLENLTFILFPPRAANPKPYQGVQVGVSPGMTHSLRRGIHPSHVPASLTLGLCQTTIAIANPPPLVNPITGKVNILLPHRR